MKIIIPDNNDPGLIAAVQRLAAKPSQHSIREVYGKPTRSTVIGSGRANLRSEGMQKEEMIQRVLGFRSIGLGYDYTLNGVLPRARVMENRREIIEELEWIESSPIRTVTVANYELARLAEKYAPSVSLAISIFAGVDNKRTFRQWAELPNVREINTDVGTFRNLRLLEELVEQGREQETCVRVIANLGCMADCARKEEHAMIKDMASLDRNSLHYAPCTFFCMRYNLENPEEFLKMPLIRPDDLGRYEDIGVAAVKIVDRIQKTPWIEKVVGHYLDGMFEGNILDLTCTYTTIGIEQATADEVAAIDMGQVMSSRDAVLKYRDRLPALMGIAIDPDYDMLSCSNACSACKGCKDTPAVKYDPKRREIVLAQLAKLEQDYLFR